MSDPNGISDIAGVYIRFVPGEITYGPEVPTAAGLVTFTNLDISSMPYDTYSVEAKADDVHTGYTSDWVDLDYLFKKWDCQVNIGGTIFDSSDDQFFTCDSGNNVGFGVTISPGLSFPLAYGNTVDESRINMTVNSPYFTGIKPTNSLTWKTEYWLDTLDIDTAIPGVLKAFKIDGNCVLPWNSHFNLKNYVDPYATTPRADFKYSAVMDQDAWFRVVNGGVLTRNSVTNLVPVTCLDNCNTSTQGLVWSKNITLSDWDHSPVSETTPLRPISYDYGNLKYDIYGGKEVGTTIVATSTSWSTIKNTANGVIFVSGNLVIDENVNPADHVFFIVKGNITIEQTVTSVRGMFFADGAITASGENDTKLSISGSLYSKAGITLDRTYTTKRNNNNSPAVEVTYDPNLIFKLHPRMWYTYENWKME